MSRLKIIAQDFAAWLVDLSRNLVGAEVVANVEMRRGQAFRQVLDAKRERLDATLDCMDYADSLPVERRDGARSQILEEFKADLVDLNITFNRVTTRGQTSPEEVEEAIASTPFEPEPSAPNSASGLGSTPNKAISHEPSGVAETNGNGQSTNTPPPRRRGRPPKVKEGGL